MKYNTKILHPAWVTGFIDGEGTFYCGISPKSDMKIGFQVTLQFVITQHIRDVVLMQKLVDFFTCGYLAKDGATKYQFRIRNINDLETHLFPLLEDYPLQTQKSKDYWAFKQIHGLILAKKHLTEEGLNKIRGIKATMNKARMQQQKDSGSWF
jgi:hypothetical protein